MKALYIELEDAEHAAVRKSAKSVGMSTKTWVRYKLGLWSPAISAAPPIQQPEAPLAAVASAKPKRAKATKGKGKGKKGGWQLSDPVTLPPEEVARRSAALQRPVPPSYEPSALAVAEPEPTLDLSGALQGEELRAAMAVFRSHLGVRLEDVSGLHRMTTRFCPELPGDLWQAIEQDDKTWLPRGPTPRDVLLVNQILHADVPADAVPAAPASYSTPEEEYEPERPDDEEEPSP